MRKVKADSEEWNTEEKNGVNGAYFSEKRLWLEQEIWKWEESFFELAESARLEKQTFVGTSQKLRNQEQWKHVGIGS